MNQVIIDSIRSKLLGALMVESISKKELSDLSGIKLTYLSSAQEGAYYTPQWVWKYLQRWVNSGESLRDFNWEHSWNRLRTTKKFPGVKERSSINLKDKIKATDMASKTVIAASMSKVISNIDITLDNLSDITTIPKIYFKYLDDKKKWDIIPYWVWGMLRDWLKLNNVGIDNYNWYAARKEYAE